MADINRLVNLNIAQWSRPGSGRPRLAAPISADATSLTVTSPLRDEGGNIIRGDVLLGIKDKNDYTENAYTPSGTLDYDGQTGNFAVGLWVTGGTSGARGYVIADSDSGTTGTLTLAFVTGTFQNNEAITDTSTGSATVNGAIAHSISADGLTHSNVVRGVDPAGLDFFTQNDSSFAVRHDGDDPVFCQVSAVHVYMLLRSLMGAVATGGNTLLIGRGLAENTTLSAFDDTGTRPFLRRNDSTDRAQFSDDGSSWTNMSTVGAHGNSAEISDHIDVNPSVSGSPSSGDLLAYNSSDSAWDNQPLSEAIGSYIQNATATYAVDASGSDSYTLTMTPAWTSYTDGQDFSFRPGTANTGASTVNGSGLGAIPLKKRNYADTETGDITLANPVEGKIRVQAVTFNAGLSGGAASGTLASNWTLPTGVYSVLFSNSDRRDVTLTNGNTTATWSGGLSGAATASANAQWAHMTSQVSTVPLTSSSTVTEIMANTGRVTLPIQATVASVSGTGSVNDGGSPSTGITGSTSGSRAAGYDQYGLGGWNAVLNVGHLDIMMVVGVNVLTNQDVFFGVSGNLSIDVNNSVYTVHHAGFIIQDGTLYASTGNGSSQTLSTAITGYTLTQQNLYRVLRSGSSWLFYVNGNLERTISSTQPTQAEMVGYQITNDAAESKQVAFAGQITFDVF